MTSTALDFDHVVSIRHKFSPGEQDLNPDTRAVGYCYKVLPLLCQWIHLTDRLVLQLVGSNTRKKNRWCLFSVYLSPPCIIKVSQWGRVPWSFQDWFLHVLLPKSIVSLAIKSYPLVMVDNRERWQWSVLLRLPRGPPGLITCPEMTNVQHWAFSYKCTYWYITREHIELFILFYISLFLHPVIFMSLFR